MTSLAGTLHEPAAAVGAYASTRTFSPGSVVIGYLDAGTWSACFGLSYRDLCLYDQTHNKRIIRPNGKELRSVTGSGGIPTSRNKVARQFLEETDGEWLFSIDTDMGFGADTVDRLIDAADPTERPIVGGLCFAGLRAKPPGPTQYYAERFLIQPTLYRWVELPGEVGFAPIVDYPRDAVAGVGATGAACLLIHFTALERIRERYGDGWFDPITHPTGGPGGRARTFSEDMSFCVRAAGVDIPIHVDTAVKTTHEKGLIYLDEETYDATRP